MPIVPLPQFEEDLKAYLAEKADRDAYERLNAPTTIVVRFGAMKMIGEFPYDGEAKPGCGSRLVVRTHRGEELGEMLTSTCPNSGCSKSVTRKQMLEYIENSGGKDYPFYDANSAGGSSPSGAKGRVLRVATKEDLDTQSAIDERRQPMIRRARDEARQARFDAKIVDAEAILGGGHVTYYYSAEQRIDHGAILSRLRQLHAGDRVEMRQVGARDDARLTADYERCGQHCCCKSFLKVFKPVSMRSAKVQKATLDPLKISGRCGRLMCCLRYEDQTYKDLKKNLPHRKTRVGTPHGDGIVIDSQILTQLVLIELDTRERVAVPVEELGEPGQAKAPEREQPARPGDTRRRPQPGTPKRPAAESAGSSAGTAAEDAPQTTKRRRKRKSPSPAGASGPDSVKSEKPPKVVGRRRPKPAGDEAPPKSEGGGPDENHDAEPSKKRRRRRRGKNRGVSGDGSGGGPGDGSARGSGGSPDAGSQNPDNGTGGGGGSDAPPG